MRDLYTVRLEEKTLLSAPAACYHLRFCLAGPGKLTWEPGQFLSFLADTSVGKTYTRAYSIASAPANGSPPNSSPSENPPGSSATHEAQAGSCFDLCVNRVPGGFFSNLLCDLEPGAELQCHGPHGLFSPRTSAEDGLLVAEGTGIAPFRSFAQGLFPPHAAPRTGARSYTLLYSAPSDDELFYDHEFRELALREPRFHYIPVVERPGPQGERPIRDRALAQLAATLLPSAFGALAPSIPSPATPPVESFAQYAYLCGLAQLVKPARAQLLDLGWQRRQVLFERYD